MVSLAAHNETAIIHPLVLINLSDQTTRALHNPDHHLVSLNNSNNTSNDKRKHISVGILMGNNKHKAVEVHNSFELIFSEEYVGDFLARDQSASLDDFFKTHWTNILDSDFLKTRSNQYETVFPRLENIGFYVTGLVSSDSKDDLNAGQKAFLKGLFRKLSSMRDAESVGNPFLCLNFDNYASKKSNTANNKLPIRVFESVEASVGSLEWAELEIEVDTLESERIAVQHVAMASNDGSSQFTEHVGMVQGSGAMLRREIKRVVGYLEDMKNSKIPIDHAKLREIAGIVRRLDSNKNVRTFDGGLNIVYEDAMLGAYLAALTRFTADSSVTVDAYARKNQNRDIFGGGSGNSRGGNNNALRNLGLAGPAGNNKSSSGSSFVPAGIGNISRGGGGGKKTDRSGGGSLRGGGMRGGGRGEWRGT